MLLLLSFCGRHMMLSRKSNLALIGIVLIGMPAIVLAELDAKKLFQHVRLQTNGTDEQLI